MSPHLGDDGLLVIVKHRQRVRPLNFNEGGSPYVPVARPLCRGSPVTERSRPRGASRPTAAAGPGGSSTWRYRLRAPVWYVAMAASATATPVSGAVSLPSIASNDSGRCRRSADSPTAFSRRSASVASSRMAARCSSMFGGGEYRRMSSDTCNNTSADIPENPRTCRTLTNSRLLSPERLR